MKKAILIFQLVLICNQISAQKSDLIKTYTPSKYYSSFEIGGMLGESHYYGDLSKGIFQIKNLHNDYGLFIRYQRTRKWAVKLTYNKGKLSADDLYNKPSLQPRNLRFFSPLQEGALMIEYMYPGFSACRQYNWSPYFTAGIAVFKFQPQAAGFGDLRSLSTEGEGLPEYPNSKVYSLTQVSIPFGIGIKFIPFKRLIIGAELCLRKTFTDYIDDVSGYYPSPAVLLAEKGLIAVKASNPSSYKFPNYDPTNQIRGSAQNMDWYCTFTLHISYAIYYDCFSENHRQNDVGGCKSF